MDPNKSLHGQESVRPFKNDAWSRRDFLGRAAISAAYVAAGATSLLSPAQVHGEDRSPLHGRFVTHVSIVRVNQIEVTPTHSFGEDEVADNRPEFIRARRDALANGWPGAKMTWAISWLALNDSRDQYR